MQFRYSRHSLERQVLRELPPGMAEVVFSQADNHYYDSLTRALVAVKRMLFQGVERDVALTYLWNVEQEIICITIHPLKDGQKERRVQNERWTPYESESAL
ncbi:MAG: hypothetical protein BZY75_05765 [SAR202 cluster bacterium Io17-Chloro-G7]|nr:MAG: hypothetical protein BZY75_05765 [SAR202 cluster bacterium Io17-Chloro-G7]